MTPDDTDRGERRHDPERPHDPAPTAHDEEHGGTEMHDDAFDRLRAADPASDAPEPAATVLRAKVDARIGADAPETTAAHPVDTSASDTGGPDTGGSGGADELARRRVRRRQPWLVAAAVAGFVAVGGGGYAAGVNGLSFAPTTMDNSARDGAAPPITLGEAEDSAASGKAENGAPGQESAAHGTQEIAPEPGIGTLVYPPTFPTASHTVFHAGAGLSDDAGEATAYTLDTTTGFTERMARKTADALGIRGEVRQEQGAWLAGSQDGDGATLRVSADGLTSFWFTGEGALTWRCAEPLPAEPKTLTTPARPGGSGDTGSGGTGTGDGAESGTSPDRAPDGDDGTTAICPQQGTAGAPSVSTAIDELRRMMDALGLDVDAFEFEGHPSGPGTGVVANHVIDGRQTGLRWAGTVSGTGSDVGITTLNGFLAPVVELGTYPTVSEGEAVERLGDPRFGSLAGPIRTLTTMPGGAVLENGDTPTSSDDAPSGTDDSRADDSAAHGTSSDTADGPPTPPGAGDEIVWPVRDVTITEATLGVAQHTLPDGAVVLIPAYELTGDGGTWSVVAVSTSSLDFAAE